MAVCVFDDRTRDILCVAGRSARGRLPGERFPFLPRADALNSSNLTGEQCDRLRERITPHRLDFQRLDKRMYAMNFRAADGRTMLVITATAAADSLRIKPHYQAVEIANRGGSTVLTFDELDEIKRRVAKGIVEAQAERLNIDSVVTDPESLS